MKRGSEVHAKLEEEIFTRVQVPIQSREDAWALQLWNLIISLRTLRESGMTREMQVWGILHGEVIAGVIDELRIGTDLDEKALRKDAELDLTITNQALLLDEKRSLLDSPDRKDDRRIVFLTDMKTRASKSIPRGASLRGTVYQLMLYQTLLADLVSNRTNWGKIIERYGLDPLKPFTETFLEQMYELEDPEAIKSDMNHKTFDTESQDPVQSSSHSIETPSSSFLRHMARLGDSVTEPSISAPSETNVPIGSQYSSISSLSPTQSFSRPISQPISQPSNANSGPVDNHQHLRPVQQVAPYTPTPLAPSSLFHRHNTLSSLLTLLAREITLTFPYGSSSLSPYLHACYRDKNTGEITGQRVFRYDADILSAYVSSEMAWWNGTRDTKGVEVEEAFKCNMCEFAPGCRWRADMKANAENRHKGSTSSAVRVQKEPGINQSKPDRVNAQDERISDGNSKPKIPGEWISETSSETVMQQQGGIEVGGGRKGQERSRSVI